MRNSLTTSASEGRADLPFEWGTSGFGHPKQTLSRHRQCPFEYRLPSASARMQSLRDESGEPSMLYRYLSSHPNLSTLPQ